MKLKNTRRVPSARPPKKSIPLLQSRNFKRVKEYIESINPQIKEMKLQVLRLLKNPKVQERIETDISIQTYLIGEGIVIDETVFGESQLLLLGCRLLGQGLSDPEEREIQEWANSLFRRVSQTSAKKFFVKIFEFFQDPIWDTLDPDLKSKLLGWFGSVWYFNSQENAEVYIKTVFKVLRNGIKINVADGDYKPNQLLGLVCDKYCEEVSKGELGSLNEIQEIARDLALLEPDLFLDCSEHLFEDPTNEQFDLLFAKLAEVNPNLVQLAGKKIFDPWSEDAA